MEAIINDEVEKYMSIESLVPTGQKSRFDLKFYPIKSVEEAEYIAELLRAAWDLGSDPILNLITVLEEHGIFVITIPFIEGFDGFSCWVNDNIPVIASRANIPGDRQRFNLAHELGHLILKIDTGLNEELVCHRFAGAFLAPRKAVYHKLGPSRTSLDTDELMILKQEYAISMQAWARRAYDLQIISSRYYRNFCKLFSIKGWRKCEPGDQIEEEKPLRFLLLIRQAVAEGIITPTRAEYTTSCSFI